MANCCEINADLAKKKRLLWTVLLINMAMFLIQFVAAWFAHSTALLADSLDMLGDMLTYALSIYVAHRSQAWLNRAAIFKSIIILIFAIIVFFEAIYKIFFTMHEPSYSMMIIFGTLGLIANGICFYLLTKHRGTDINLRSTWICSRNDIIGNIAVIITAFLVLVFHSRWPDIIVGLAFTGVLIHSAIGILQDVRSNKTPTC